MSVQNKQQRTIAFKSGHNTLRALVEIADTTMIFTEPGLLGNVRRTYEIADLMQLIHEAGYAWRVTDDRLTTEQDAHRDRIRDAGEAADRARLPMAAAIEALREGYNSAAADREATRDAR